MIVTGQSAAPLGGPNSCAQGAALPTDINNPAVLVGMQPYAAMACQAGEQGSNKPAEYRSAMQRAVENANTNWAVGRRRDNLIWLKDVAAMHHQQTVQPRSALDDVGAENIAGAEQCQLSLVAAAAADPRGSPYAVAIIVAIVFIYGWLQSRRTRADPQH